MIRRQVLFLAVGFAAAVIIKYYMGDAVSFCLGGMLLILVISMRGKATADRKKLIALLILISYFSGCICYGIKTFELDNQQRKIMNMAKPGGAAVISGEIREVERKKTESGDPYIRLVVKSVNGSILVNYYYEKDYLQNNAEVKQCRFIPGNIIKADGEVLIPSGSRNPGCFDYNLYLKSRSIPLTMTAESIQGIKENSGFNLRGKIYTIKANFVEQLEKSADRETAAMMNAIMFGDKGELDEELLETFQKNGTAHILAVSGLHIGIIYGFIFRLWSLAGELTGGLFFGQKRKAFFCFNAFFFGCYMMLADFSPSVVRAVAMVMLHVFAQLTGRRYDLCNASLCVLVAILAINPFMLFNAGFQMSFLAVLTMVVVLPFITRFYSGVFLSGIAIQAGMGPFIIFNFNYLSIIAVLINLPVIMLAGLIVPAGLIEMALTGSLFFDAGAKAVQFLCNILKWININTEISGITTFQIPSPPLWILFLYYISLLVLATEEGRLAVLRAVRNGNSIVLRIKNRFIYLIKAGVVILMISVAFAHVAGDSFDSCNLTFVDVGQGDCMCIKSDGIYLIDGGGNFNYNLGKKLLRSYLLKNGMSHVDGAFVTHLHTDHYKGICELCREKMVKKLYVYEGNRLIEKQIVNETGMNPEDIVYIHSGETIEIGKQGIFNRNVNSIEVLWPQRKTESEYASMLQDREDENAMSLVLGVHFRNYSISGRKKETSLLVTGDMGEEGEKELIAEAAHGLESQILKVGHHGSKYSSSNEFLDIVEPDFAVIQVGKNNYGHPSEELLTKMKAKGIITYRNDKEGAIGFEIKKGEIKKIVTMKKGKINRIK